MQSKRQKEHKQQAILGSFQVSENDRDMLNFCKSPSTPLPSALSVLDISSFRLESPTVQDDGEDGSDMPDLADPCSPPTIPKFASHAQYPACTFGSVESLFGKPPTTSPKPIVVTDANTYQRLSEVNKF